MIVGYSTSMVVKLDRKFFLIYLCSLTYFFLTPVGHKLGDKMGSPFKKHKRQGSDASSQGTSVASNADPGVASDSDDEVCKVFSP